MPDTTKGHHTIIKVGDADNHLDAATWTRLGNVTELTPFTADADDIDVSHMESIDQWREFDPGWAEAGEIEVTLQYVKSENATIYGLFRVKRGYQIEFSDGSVWEFDGFINSFGNEAEREDIITTTVGVKISGKPAFTPAA
jgi:hypothetical protein